jgi:hypothetical protein
VLLPKHEEDGEASRPNDRPAAVISGMQKGAELLNLRNCGYTVFVVRSRHVDTTDYTAGSRR